MKKSKSNSGGKRKERDSSEEPSKSKRSRAQSRSEERKKKTRTESKSTSRKTRWHDDPPLERGDTKAIERPDKRSAAVEPPRIVDLLDDEEKTVDHLFSALPAATLKELIPDYLRKCPREELKKICIEEIKKMSKELVLHILSGKDPKSFEDSVKSAAEEQAAKPEKQSSPRNLTEEKIQDKEKPKNPEAVRIVEENDSSSRDVLELFATSKEMEGIIDEENKAPTETEDSPSDKDDHYLESDADLLELEMRARAIRSLLRAKNKASEEADQE